MACSFSTPFDKHKMGGNFSAKGFNSSSAGTVSKDFNAKSAKSKGPNFKASSSDGSITNDRGSITYASFVFLRASIVRSKRSPCSRNCSTILGCSRKTTLCPAMFREPPKYVPIAPAPKTSTFNRSGFFVLDTDDCKVASFKMIY